MTPDRAETVALQALAWFVVLVAILMAVYFRNWKMSLAALVALAEANRAAGPAARSQVFLAVTAEESGLLGSEYYGANPVFPLAQTVGGVNMDAIAMAGPARDVTVIGGGKSELDAVLDRYSERGAP